METEQQSSQGVGGPGRSGSHSKSEGEAQSRDAAGQGSSRKAHIPTPECLTGNTLASPHGADTMCFPWATTLLMSQVCCKNHVEHPRGKPGNFRQCACSCKATKPAVTLASVSESLSREQRKCIREAFSCLPSQVRTSHMSGSSLPSLPSLLFSTAWRILQAASMQLAPNLPPSPVALNSSNAHSSSPKGPK